MVAGCRLLGSRHEAIWRGMDLLRQAIYRRAVQPLLFFKFAEYATVSAIIFANFPRFMFVACISDTRSSSCTHKNDIGVAGLDLSSYKTLLGELVHVFKNGSLRGDMRGTSKDQYVHRCITIAHSNRLTWKSFDQSGYRSKDLDGVVDQSTLQPIS